MCGIAGIFNYREPAHPIDRGALVRMTRALSHRGPDGEGFYYEGPLGLGHRRLKIVDLTATGDQPMLSRDGSCCISYNGEFYDHMRYRPALAARGFCFRGTSDTETLLCLLQEYGPESLKNLSAIFGFAFWDVRNSVLTLARDPLGVKQIYIHDDGARIIFASEIKALLEHPDVPREPDAEGINQYLHFHTTLFERTFFKGIEQLRAGEYLQVSPQGIRRRIYWNLEEFGSGPNEVRSSLETLKGTLADVVSAQLMSDVPVGLFFSGGIDSTAVATFATRAGESPLCFGAHFSGQGVIDERPYQQAAAERLGVDLRLVTMDGSTFPTDIMKLLYYQDQPVIGPAKFPMYYVSHLAGQHVKVCLGGQGGDEIFGGYARYALVRPWHVLKTWSLGARESNGGGVGGNLLKQLIDPRVFTRLLRISLISPNWRARYFNNFAKVPERYWQRVFADPGYISRERARETFEEGLNRSQAIDPVDKVMHWDMQTFLPGLFHQDDRMSMANSLESRVPLADPRLVRLAFKLGYNLKFRGGATKWILRQALSDAIPAAVLNHRKVGFDTPAETWMRGRHFGFVQDILTSRQAAQRGLWDNEGLKRLLNETTHPYWFDVTWKVLCIEAWARVFLDKEVPSVARA